MKVRYRVVPKQNKKSSFYVNCHSQHVTIQAADSAFSTLLSLRERLSAWYKEKNISFDDIPTNTDTACCFAWKVDTETGEGLDTYIMAVAVVLVNGLKRLKHNVKLKRLKIKNLEASLLRVMTNNMNMMM